MGSPLDDELNLPLARSAVDRDAESRDIPDFLSNVLANQATRVLPIFDGKVLLRSLADSPVAGLLGSQGVWEENRWSVLAGFVEPGESLNAAVVREMREEAGIEVSNATYLGSQSWPFPYSLMLGFAAQAHGSAVKPDGVEIEKLRWFSREELAAEAHHILLPTRLSIARAIIERWFGTEIVSATELS